MLVFNYLLRQILSFRSKMNVTILQCLSQDFCSILGKQVHSHKLTLIRDISSLCAVCCFSRRSLNWEQICMPNTHSRWRKKWHSDTVTDELNFIYNNGTSSELVIATNATDTWPKTVMKAYGDQCFKEQWAKHNSWKTTSEMYTIEWCYFNHGR